ncbi:hypothetical protein ANCDUO_03617 [Ancylostoma duodenale]|uniref:Uncharacterized protein n=1 Tax=Ancylostoma duodenale TaxID=51022 RepID=A0A0C2GX05_9BILA|nr:hypothetical protein ANCDUO_03617 [Ancylostoma duodenale]
MKTLIRPSNPTKLFTIRAKLTGSHQAYFEQAVKWTSPIFLLMSSCVT